MSYFINPESFIIPSCNLTTYPSTAPTGSIYMNSETREVYMMTSGGWKPVIYPYTISEDSNAELVSRDKHEEYKNYFLNILNDISRFNMTKKSGYLISLEDMGDDSEYLKSKYFEWCYRYNIPYLYCKYIFVKYNITLNLNPKDNFYIKKFNNNSKNVLEELFYGHEMYFLYSTYKIDRISIYDIEYKLNKLVELYRDHNNLEIEY